jgi:hypothetical protein
MRPKRFLILFCAALVLAAVLIVVCAPLLVAGGLRLWMARVAGQQGLRVETERIEAPFLRPVIIHKLRITNGTNAPFRIDCAAARLEMGLNLAGIFTGSSRALRTLSAETVTLDIRRNPRPAASPPRFAWPALENLLSDNFKLSGVQLHVENGSTIVDLRDATLTGSEMEAGVFSAKEVAIASPWFHKTFSNLHGATAWQESRLVIGALSLMRGLDLDTSTVDLSHIGESSLGIEMNVDAFGGKIRARVSSDDRGENRIWDVAGNGSEISLAQMSDALEWTNRASGSLHACRFTFRGEAADFRNATATLWAEVSGLTWRDRTADTVMIGASLYNREVQVEQVYIKQRNNQLTLSGEFAWPEKSSDWIKPAFRGDISASINDLGDLARLFGWSASDFSGQVVANGSVNAREQKLGGQLSVSGNSLILFRSPIESVEVKIGLADSRLAITQFELRQKNDFLRAQGDFALAGDRSYSAAVQTSVAEIADYAGFLSRWTEPFLLGGNVSVDWTGNGVNGADSGTLHARGRKLRPLESSIVPFDAEFEADYSPENIFFRQFHLWNQRGDLSAFVTVAKNYLQLQTVRLSLNGQPRVQGNIFLPISLSKIRQNSRWLAALDADPHFDVDVTLEAIDLSELAAAVNTSAKMSGKLAGKIELYGTPASLEGKSEVHCRDFVFENAPALSGDMETRLVLGVASFKANAIVPGSDALKLEGAFPLKLEKLETEYALKTDGPLSATVSFPAIFLTKVPAYLSRQIFTRGILSGNLTITDSIRHPSIVGDVNLIDGQFLRGASFSTGLTFRGRTAALDFAQIRQNGADVFALGEIDFRDLPDVSITIQPSTPLSESTSFEPADCVKSVEFFPAASTTLPSMPVRALGFSGSLFTRNWTVSFPNPNGADPPRTFPFCSDDDSRGKTLTLQVAPGFAR